MRGLHGLFRSSSIPAVAAFALVASFAAPVWSSENDGHSWYCGPDRTVWEPGAEGGLGLVLGALGAMLVLCLLTRAHAGRGRTWGGLYGVAMALGTWWAVLGSLLWRQDWFHENVWWSMLVSLMVVLLGWPVAALRARRWGEAVRLVRLRLLLAGALLYLTWMDAAMGFGMLGGIGSTSWWKARAIVLAGCCAWAWALAPRSRAGRRELRRGWGLLFAWSLLLPFVPWNEDKRYELDLRGLDGATQAEVEERLADHFVGVMVHVKRVDEEGWWSGSEDVVPRDLLRNLDLSGLEFDYLYLPAYGGVHIGFEDGCAWLGVNFD